MTGVIAGPMEVPGYAFVSTPPAAGTIEDLAADNGLELMVCNKTHCKLTLRSCVKMWWATKNKPNRTWGVTGRRIFQSHCEGCEVGENIAKTFNIKELGKGKVEMSKKETAHSGKVADNNSVVTIDFAGREHLLEDLTSIAAAEMRTVPMQALWMLKEGLLGKQVDGD